MEDVVQQSVHKSNYFDPSSAAEILGRHVPFLGLPENLLGEIYQRGEIVEVPQHANIIVEGEDTAGMYILLEGLVGVYKSEVATNKGTLLKSLTQGEAFGDMSLIDRAPRSATVVAEVDVILFHLSADVFASLVASDPELGLQLYRNFASDLTGRLRSMNNDLIVSQRQLWRLAFSRGDKKLLRELRRQSGEDASQEQAERA